MNRKSVLNEGEIQSVDYVFMFKTGDYNDAEGLNLKTTNEAYLTKISK